MTPKLLMLVTAAQLIQKLFQPKVVYKVECFIQRTMPRYMLITEMPFFCKATVLFSPVTNCQMYVV